MKYAGLLLFIMLCHTLYAVPFNPELIVYRNNYAVADTDTTTIVKKNSASAGITYGTDALFFGRTSPVKYPFVSADMILNYKSGFFIYGSALKVLGYKPVIDEIDVGGGYFYRLSKKYTGTISYTRFIFANQSTIIKSASSNDINFKNSYNWKILKSSIIADYLFGKSNDFFITISNAKYIESKFSVFDDTDYLSINPTINVILGTQNFVQRYSVDHQYQLEADNIFIKNENGRQARANAKFNMLNYSFKLPLAYNRSHYTLEASWKYSIPVNVEGTLKNRRESFFNFTFYYVFY